MLENILNLQYFKELKKSKKARVIIISGPIASGKTQFIKAVSKKVKNIGYLTEQAINALYNENIKSFIYYDLSITGYNITPKDIISTMSDLEYHLNNSTYIFLEVQNLDYIHKNFLHLTDHIYRMEILNKKDRKIIIKRLQNGG